MFRMPPSRAIPEVRFFDPPAALYGGEDGLDVVRVLSGVGLRLAHPGGTIVIEHGEWQGEAIRAILAADGWRAAATHPDLTLPRPRHDGHPSLTQPANLEWVRHVPHLRLP